LWIIWDILISCRLLRKWNVGGDLRLRTQRSKSRHWEGVLRPRGSKVPPGTCECYALNAITEKKQRHIFWSKYEASLIFREKWKCCSPCLWQPYKLQFSAFSIFCCSSYKHRTGWAYESVIRICIYGYVYSMPHADRQHKYLPS